MYHSTRIGRYARSISMQRWSLSSSTISSSELSDRFLMATKLVASIPRTPSNEEKLELYALYKQACKGEAIENFESSVFDFVATMRTACGCARAFSTNTCWKPAAQRWAPPPPLGVEADGDDRGDRVEQRGAELGELDVHRPQVHLYCAPRLE